MTPNAILKHLIPHVASASTSQNWIFPDLRRINGVWIF